MIKKEKDDEGDAKEKSKLRAPLLLFAVCCYSLLGVYGLWVMYHRNPSRAMAADHTPLLFNVPVMPAAVH